jgi:hypothetical protein
MKVAVESWLTVPLQPAVVASQGTCGAVPVMKRRDLTI